MDKYFNKPNITENDYKNVSGLRNNELIKSLIKLEQYFILYELENLLFNTPEKDILTQINRIKGMIQQSYDSLCNYSETELKKLTKKE